MLDTRDLSMRFGGVQAVNNVNFSLRDRELRCLIGPNGAGKSTFFKCLTGQIRLDPSHGRVFIRGQDVSGWRAYEIVRLGVGIKTQVPSVMNGLNVEENLFLSARRVHSNRASAEADQLVRIIHEVNEKSTVVVVDHDMQFVRMLGGKVTVLHQGAILREGPVDEVLADAEVRKVYIGSRAK